MDRLLGARAARHAHERAVVEEGGGERREGMALQVDEPPEPAASRFGLTAAAQRGQALDRACRTRAARGDESSGAKRPFTNT